MTAAGTGNALLAAALAYAVRGWPVFPCHRDKTPATTHGFRDATTDPDRIRRWWAGHPHDSIGVACGPAGLVVIDIDVAKGGLASWQRLKAAHGIDDETLTSLTGGGGWHLLYRVPERFRGRNSAGKLGPGVDVRANGGYIIVPPSGHPSGREYVWDPDRGHLDPILLPDCLAALLEQRGPEERASSDARSGRIAVPFVAPFASEDANSSHGGKAAGDADAWMQTGAGPRRPCGMSWLRWAARVQVSATPRCTGPPATWSNR